MRAVVSLTVPSNDGVGDFENDFVSVGTTTNVADAATVLEPVSSLESVNEFDVEKIFVVEIVLVSLVDGSEDFVSRDCVFDRLDVADEVPPLLTVPYVRVAVGFVIVCETSPVCDTIVPVSVLDMLRETVPAVMVDVAE